MLEMMKKYTLVRTILLLLGLAILLLLMRGIDQAFGQDAGKDFIALQVTYKLDPRITGGIQMGERWVSPPLYDVISQGGTYTIEARVEGVDANGERTDLNANWVSADPNLATIVPTKFNRVAILIRGQGETTLELSADGIEKTLYLSSAYQANPCTNLRVAVSQESQPDLPAQMCSILLPLVIQR